jgi:hypothetical protein
VKARALSARRLARHRRDALTLADKPRYCAVILLFRSSGLPIFSRDGVNILYIHVPKTGGTSVEDLFQRNGFAVSYLNRDVRPTSLNVITRCSPQHMCRQQLESIFNLGRFKYIFMTVREPYARLLSTFRMRHANPEKPVSFDTWAAAALERYASGPFVYDNHIRPQADFHVPRADIFKQEDGYDDVWVQKLAHKTGFTFQNPTMQRQMVSHKSGETPTMSDATRSLVRYVYAQDFVQFGYKP